MDEQADRQTKRQATNDQQPITMDELYERMQDDLYDGLTDDVVTETWEALAGGQRRRMCCPRDLSRAWTS